jgi:hypothetical protein
MKNVIKPVVKAGGKVVKFAKRNSNWLLAIMAMLGLGVTTGLAVDATVKAVKLCEKMEVKGRKNVIKTAWKLYIPTVGCFIVTTLSIVGNAHINARRIATMTGLYAMSQADLKALKEKAKEYIGPKKADKMQDDIAAEKVDSDPPPAEDQIIKTGHGNKLFKEWLTGQYIRTSPEWIEAIQEKMDAKFDKEFDGTVEVAYYLDLLGIPTDNWVAKALWDRTEMLERGQAHFTIDCHELKWMEVNGVQEMVGYIRPIDPTSI